MLLAVLKAVMRHSLTSGEGLRQNLRGEGRFGSHGAALLLEQMLSQRVPPAAVQETVQDV